MAWNRLLARNDRPRGAAGACPECGGPLAPTEGCQRCLACGFSVCG